ncbi:MAG: ATP-binding protein [Terriglobales bacterium]|jgi:PAS domain S-box-containing protein|nr:ATP-binding protein [Terriglobales bacterium]
MANMRVKPPLLRNRHVAPARAAALRYGVAVLSTILAIIPGFLLSDLVESRLVVFAVAIMVSAWYGGWKPGLVATSFALTVSSYFSFVGARSHADYRKAIIHLTLFVFVALLICSFNAALRSAQEGLRRSEANFRSLVMNAPYGICRCNADAIILDANPALVSMLGRVTASELVGMNVANLYADSQEWFKVADYFRSLQSFNGLLAEWKKKDGVSTSLRLSGRAIRAERNTIFFELFAEDVTERYSLEQQLRQSQKMEAVGRLAGGIAHDFNNLLMVISGYSEFLLEKIGDNPDLRPPAQEIAKAANRATALTRQLLAFSRKQMLMPRVLDLNDLVSENLKMLTRVIGEDIDLVMAPAADLGAVKADPGQIEQVIMNLAVNARDAMPQGGKLTIETANVTLDESYARFHASAAPGEYIMLAISDSGVGMDAETQSHIFEPFFSTKGAKGTGLGLSTVYGIIKQSGGFIWVYSEPEKGTTFKIYLPRAVADREAEVAQPTVSAQKISKGYETVLVVEDEPNLRRLTSDYLRNQGYTVLEAPEGDAAIRVSESYPDFIHLLLTDVIMPGMNGRELAVRISKDRPQVRVLYMSGYTENAIGHNGTLDAGITLLQKPFTLPDLKAKVRELLDTPLPQEAVMSFREIRQARPARDRKDALSSFRAKRFSLQLPLKYRPLGEQNWHSGTTENISRSGMLFRAEELISPNVQLEINLVLPREIAGLSDAEVVCRGEIVRAVEGSESRMSPAIAAKILQYHFQHGSKMPSA